MQTGNMRRVVPESANAKAVRGLMIGMAALVVLSVSGFGTVMYIQLMSKAFPEGPLQIACYLGAAANVVLMVVLLVGKFVWFRPGAHEVASWIVTGVELLVAIMNMMLAYELATGQTLSSFMASWYFLAPVSPMFSMVGAIVLIMTSTELRKRHQELEVQEQKDQADREFGLEMHRAEMEVKHQYLGYIKTKLQAELNAPERHEEMADHAAMLVSDVLSGISGIQSVPRLKGSRTVPALPPGTPAAPPVVSPGSSAAMGELDPDDVWLSRANARIEQERARRRAQEAAAGEEREQEEDASPKQADLVEDEGERVEQRSALVRRLFEVFSASDERLPILRRVEKWFGLEMAGDRYVDRPLAQRVERVVDKLLEQGYGLDQVEAMIEKYLPGEGGDDAKKK